MDNSFTDVSNSEDNPFTTVFPDWLIIIAFDKMNKFQQDTYKDRYIQLKQQNRQFDENAFSKLLKEGVVHKPTTSSCDKPFCVNGKLIDGDTFLGYCTCYGKTGIATLISQSFMPKVLLSKDFKTFVPRDAEQDAIKSKVCKSLTLFTGSKEKIVEGYLFLGKSLRGKTHLASVVANCYLKNNISVRYFNYEQDLNKIKDNLSDKDYQNRIYTSLSTVKVLFIDDLFRSKPNEMDLKIIYRIIDDRYNKQLPVIVTTKLTYDELERLSSSLLGKILELAVPNVFEFNQDTQAKFFNF